MDTEKKNFKSNKHIIIMSILSIFFSLLTGAPSVYALLIISLLPLVCSILFLIKKNPVFGIVCTIFFFLNRIATFTRGTLLATIIILAITAYFVYVNYLSIQDWKIRNAHTDSN